MLINVDINYAKKNPYEGLVDEPVAIENKINKSDATIYHNDPYKEFNPLNPIQAGIDIDEYNSVDNYIIDLKTLNTRIKYFSPTYKNIKLSAQSSYWMAYYARGGNQGFRQDASDAIGEINSMKTLLSNSIVSLKTKLATMNSTDPDYLTLSAQIEAYQKMYQSAVISYATIKHTINALGLSKALYNVGNVDNNNQVSFARRKVEKNITMAVLSYLQLEYYVNILEKQQKLYYDMYLLKQKNLNLGIATSIDVLDSLNTYEKIKNDYNSTKKTMRNVKEQICNYLGYNISDIDKLEFVEPDVDFDYINSINLEIDKQNACTSNSSYKAIKLSDKDKKLPQSTGEEILNKRQNYISEKVSASIDDLYTKIKATQMSYEASLYLDEITKINDQMNKRKLESNLISDLEFCGLEIQNLANKLQVKVAKYNLISATNNYYFAVMGDLDIY